MKIQISTKKFRLTPDIEARIEKKLGKLDRYFSKDADATAKLFTLKGQEVAEITVSSEGNFYRAQVSTLDMFSSIEGACDHLEKQIQKHKSKLEKRLKQGAFTEPYAMADVEDVPDYGVIKVKKFPVKPVSTEEAILQMEMLGHNFFVYRDIDTEEVYVIYKRDDGGYGQIVPN